MVQIARARESGRHGRAADLEAEIRPALMPLGGSGVWAKYQRLSGRRGSNGFGPLPLSWSDIDAFCRLTRTGLEPWEVDLIEEIDALFLREWAKTTRSKGLVEPDTSSA